MSETSNYHAPDPNDGGRKAQDTLFTLKAMGVMLAVGAGIDLLKGGDVVHDIGEFVVSTGIGLILVWGVVLVVRAAKRRR